ncbi:unnamed protein product [Calicophoron daubneyi]|uniref:Uncharacterized protein n=1 Tax=Calicophoron daubneyi TaxID=300641 RepID=A0AAV2T4D7_CALDB
MYAPDFPGGRIMWDNLIHISKQNVFISVHVFLPDASSLSCSDSSGSAFRQGVGHLGSVIPPSSVTITTRTQPLPSSQPLPPMTQPAFYPNQVFTNDRTNLRSRDESAHPQSCLTPDSSSCDSSRPTVVFGRHMTSSTRPTTSDPSDVNTSLVVCDSRVSNCHPSHSTDDLPPPSSNINVLFPVGRETRRERDRTSWTFNTSTSTFSLVSVHFLVCSQQLRGCIIQRLA